MLALTWMSTLTLGVNTFLNQFNTAQAFIPSEVAFIPSKVAFIQSEVAFIQSDVAFISSEVAFIPSIHSSHLYIHPICTSIHPIWSSIHPICTSIHPIYTFIPFAQADWDQSDQLQDSQRVLGTSKTLKTLKFKWLTNSQCKFMTSHTAYTIWLPRMEKVSC